VRFEKGWQVLSGFGAEGAQLGFKFGFPCVRLFGIKESRAGQIRKSLLIGLCASLEYTRRERHEIGCHCVATIGRLLLDSFGTTWIRGFRSLEEPVQQSPSNEAIRDRSVDGSLHS
jgi:hypothetical protein